MGLVSTLEEVLSNAQSFTDAVHDGALNKEEAKNLVSAGRVYLPFRYGDALAFAPAKFIGYTNNTLNTYKDNVYERNGGRARVSVSRVIGFDAEECSEMELQLANYCQSIGVELHAHKHSFWLTDEAKKFIISDRSAINDLKTQDVGNNDPEYRRRMAGSYFRDSKVRKSVIDRADGKCEFCGQSGFVDQKNNRFLESHHIISLSEQGIDKVSNVIALCPNHHREAHFGKRWKSLQDEFLEIISRKAAETE